MSTLTDSRYRQPEYAAFRELVGAWVTCGGAEALAVEFEVGLFVVDRWRLGTSAPHPLLRDQVVAWIAGKVRVTVFVCFRCGKKRQIGRLQGCPKNDRQWCARDGTNRQDNASGPGDGT